MNNYFSAVLFLIGSIILFLISFTLNKYGIVIGWTIGLIISLLFKFLSLKLKKAKDVDKTNKLIVFFIFFRFFLIISGLIFCFLMQFYFKVIFFYYSAFTYSFALTFNNLIIIFDSKLRKNE